MTIPERIKWAIELLDVRPDDQIIEIGGGNGVAAHLVCERLGDDGRLAFVERSDVAIVRATARNDEAVRQGKLVPMCAAITDARLEAAAFDKVFAVNVNVFWTGDAATELETIGRSLKPEGMLLLVYEAPTRDRLGQFSDEIAVNMKAGGFESDVARNEGGTLLAVTGRRNGREFS
jgi:SAM-dependent methyltransferase